MKSPVANEMERKSWLTAAPIAAALLTLLLWSEGQSFAKLRNPLDLLGDRSPGARDAGALFNTKPDRKPTPTERVLAAVRERPAAIPPELLPEQPPYTPELALVDDPIIIPPLTDTPLVSMPPVFDQGPVRRDEPGVPRVPILPAVPEPSTWAMMILGFFAVGSAIRRRNRLGASQDLLNPSRNG